MSQTAEFQETLRRLAVIDEGFVDDRAVGLGRVAGAVTDVAAALGYDVEAALVDPDGP